LFRLKSTAKIRVKILLLSYYFKRRPWRAVRSIYFRLFTVLFIRLLSTPSSNKRVSAHYPLSDVLYSFLYITLYRACSPSYKEHED